MEEISEQVQAVVEDLRRLYYEEGEAGNHDLRRCLRRLDRTLFGLTALVQAQNVDEVPPGLRENLLNLLTLQLHHLVEGGGGAPNSINNTADGNIREIYTSICDQCYHALAHFVASEDSGAVPLRPEEAQQIVDRIIDLLQYGSTTSRGDGDHSDSSDSSLALQSEELLVLGYLLDIIIHQCHRASVTTTRRPAQDNDTDSSPHQISLSSQSGDASSNLSQEPSNNNIVQLSRLEKLLGVGQVPLLDLIVFVLPVAIHGMETISWQPSLQMDYLSEIHVRLRQFVDHILQHVFTTTKLRKLPSVLNLLESSVEDSRVVVDEETVQQEAMERLHLIQTYTFELLDYSFQALDQAILFFQANPHQVAGGSNNNGGDDSDDDDNQVERDRDHVEAHCTTLCYLTCAALENLNEFGMIEDKHKLASIRSLWTLYTKVYLAISVSDSPDHSLLGTGEVVGVLMVLGNLALTVNDQGILFDRDATFVFPPLDNDMQHCLSVTFLAAFNFPSLFLKHGRFLSILERLAMENAAVRRLVQGAALHQLAFPTIGNERDHQALEKVVDRLVEIGQTPAHEKINSQLWDSFFRDMHKRIHQSQSKRGRLPG